MISCLQCSGCKKIPLELQECKNCLAILCKDCEETIRAKYSLDGFDFDRDVMMIKCPDEDCSEHPSTTFGTQKFSSKMMLHQLENNVVKHSCEKEQYLDVEVNEEEKDYYLDKLFDHFRNSCTKFDFDCPLCEYQSSSH